MQFRVPQFIDMEDKVFGPLTIKQFFYVIGAASSAFLIWTLVPIRIIAIILIVLISGFFLALAFVKYNDRPFIDLVENAFKYFSSSKIYVWKQPGLNRNSDPIAPKVKIVNNVDESLLKKEKLNRLRSLSLDLDVLDKNNTQGK